MTITKRRTWGIEHFDEWRNEYLYRHAEIRNPFNDNGKWTVSLNEKFLLECIVEGVHRIVVKVGEREMQMAVPPAKYLKQLEKEGMVEVKKSMFQGSPDMKLYKITLGM